MHALPHKLRLRGRKTFGLNITMHVRCSFRFRSTPILSHPNLPSCPIYRLRHGRSLKCLWGRTVVWARAKLPAVDRVIRWVKSWLKGGAAEGPDGGFWNAFLPRLDGRTDATEADAALKLYSPAAAWHLGLCDGWSRVDWVLSRDEMRSKAPSPPFPPNQRQGTHQKCVTRRASYWDDMTVSEC